MTDDEARAIIDSMIKAVEAALNAEDIGPQTTARILYRLRNGAAQ